MKTEQQFYRCMFDGEESYFLLCEDAKEIKIEGTEERFFVHKSSIGKTVYWHISEMKTGRLVHNVNCKTRQLCVDICTEKIKANLKWLKELIENRVKESGLSPACK